MKKKTGKIPSPSANAKVETGEMAQMHCEWMRDEMLRQQANRLERWKHQSAYQDGTSKEDIVGEHDWLYDVNINRFRPDVDLITGELNKRRQFPRFTYMGGEKGGKRQQYEMLAEKRETQSRAIIYLSDYFAERFCALQDAVTTGDGWLFYGIRNDAQTGRAEATVQHIRWDSVLWDSINTTQSGGIDNCRFIARFSLVETKRAKHLFPNYADEIDGLARGLPTGSRRPIDGNIWFDENWHKQVTGKGDAANSNLLVGGDLPSRKFVCYGVMYYRDVDGKINKYPFFTDRGMTEIVQVGKETWGYSHNMYPFLRWTDGIRQDGTVYSKMADGRVGLEKVMNFGLRKILRQLGRSVAVWNRNAMPPGFAGGEPHVFQQRLEEFKASISAELDRDNPVVYEHLPNSIRFENPSGGPQEVANALAFLQGSYGSSGAAIHPSITGSTGGSTPTAGVALRQYLDTMLAGYTALFEADRRQIVRAGKMNLYNLRDFDMQNKNALVSDDGMLVMLPDIIMPDSTGEGDVALDALASGDIGISIVPYEQIGTRSQHETSLLSEALKMYSSTDPQLAELVGLCVLDEMNMSKDYINMIAERLVKKGVSVPVKLLNNSLRQLKEQVNQQAQKTQGEDRALQVAAAKGEIEVSQTQAQLNAAKALEAGAKAATAGKSEGGEGKSGGGAAAAGGDKDAAENYRLRQQLEEANQKLAAVQSAMGGAR